jgi:hypothetical protein
MLSDSALLTFKAISNFINCLNEVFGKDHRSLKLYAHLLNKTTLSNEKPIVKHIECFRTFCIENREAIFNKNIDAIKVANITYSKRVYINIVEIFTDADSDTKPIIWIHMLTISALCDPTGKARQILQERAASKKDGEGQEEDFLKNIIGKVEEHVDPNANPMEAVTSIMKSGIFSELVGGMGNGLENGTLDLGKLMGTVQTMVSTLNENASQSNDGSGEAVQMINNMVQNMNNTIEAQQNGEDPPPPPDLSQMMNMMGPMLGGALNQQNMNLPNADNSNSIENKINAELSKAKKEGKLLTDS